MKTNIFYLFILMQLYGLFPATAQQSRSAYDNVSRLSSYYPVSTEASRLFRRSPESMDYARGRATIRIPVFEIKTGSFTLPISLAYTTGGIRVTDLNGAVALGWALEAEPAISREVRGEPDETYFLSNKSQAEQNNAFFQYRLAVGETDVCADIFHFRTLGNSGKFVLESSNNMEFKPQLIGDKNVKVSVPGNSVRYGFTEIDLQESDGTYYRFGTEGREFTSNNNYRHPTTWKATEISSPDGEKISFSYNAHENQERHPVRYDYYAFEDNEVGYYDPHPMIPETPGYWKGVDGDEEYYHFDGEDEYGQATFTKWNEGGRKYYGVTSFVSVKYISQIRFPNGMVSFLYSTSGSKDLQEIRVSDLSGKTLKTVTFVKHTCADGRILLDQVLVKDADGKGIEKYAFEYYPCPLYGGFNVYSKAMDYWGYYNGQTGNTDLVPVQQVSFLDENHSSLHELWIGGGDREASYLNCLSYSLKSVTYPTGGQTTYMYELHRVDRGPKGVTSAGGLRLSAILDTGLDIEPIQRTFTYYRDQSMNEEYRGIGSMRYPITFWAFNERLDKCYLFGDWSSGYFNSRSRDYTVYSSNNLVCDDNDIYYESVVEDLNGNCITHYFVNDVWWNSDEDYFNNSMYRDYFDENLSNSCLLTTERRTELADGDSVYRTTIEMNEDYHSGPLKSLRRRGMVVNCHSVGVDQIPNYQYYYSGNVEVENKMISAVGKNDGLCTLTTSPHGNVDESSEFVYTDSSQGGSFPYHLTREHKAKDASGGVYSIRYTYPFDRADAVSQGMTAKGLNAYPLERQHYKDGVLQKIFRYTYQADNTVTSGYSLKKIAESTDAGHTQFADVEIYDAYLSSGKPLQVTRNDGTQICFLWGYENQQVIAVVENATIARIKQLTGLNPETVASASTCAESVYTALEGLRSSLPAARVTVYRYQPLRGVIQVKGPDGQSAYSEYDPSGRLSRVKDTLGHPVTEYEYNVINK